MKMKTMMASLLSAMTSIACLSSHGADLVVASGASETISGTQTYGQIIVNGTLNISAGANITASRLMCGTNGTGTAVFNMGANAKLKITGTNGNGLDCCFSYNTPCEASLSSGASISTGNAVLSYKGTGTSLVTLSDLSITASGTFFLCRDSGSSSVDSTQWMAQVRLTGEDAFLSVSRMVRNQYGSGRVLFNGGCIKTYNRQAYSWIASNQNYTNTKIMLEGENGNPVVIEVNHDIAYCFGPSGETTKCGVQGDCDLVFRGTKVASIYSSTSAYPGGVSLTHTGRTIVQGGGIKLGKVNTLPATTDVEVKLGATFDLAGFSQTVSSVSGGGCVTDSVGTAVLTVAGNATPSVLSGNCVGISVVKSGSADMTVYAGSDLADLRVYAGTATVRCLRRTGYRFYRFVPTARYGANGTGTQYNELYLFDPSGADVTRTYTTYSHGARAGDVPNPSQPLYAIDGDPTTKYYVGNPIDNAWLALEFASPQPVFQYTFANGDDYGPIHKFAGRTDRTEPPDYNPALCRDVSGFRFDGSNDGVNWWTIDSVSSFVPEDTRNYVYPRRDWPRRATVGNAYVDNGATLVLDDVDAAFGSLLCRGTLSRINGAGISVGGDVDGVVAHPELSGMLNLVKTGGGTTTVLGENSFSGVVDVQGGTLRFADVGAAGPFFRFVVTANRDNANGNAIQFSELALYDANGVRVNENLTFIDKDKAPGSLADGEITAIYKAGSSECPDKMTDGSTNTKCGLYTTTKPNPVTMRLAAAYASSRVVSYALATANDHKERDPAGWYLESSADGSAWTRLDTRDLVEVGTNRYSWASYNDGLPYYATNMIPMGAAFSSSAVVSVVDGAVLDLTSSTTAIGALRVEAVSAGEIRGGSIAANGSINITGELARQQCVVLPLTFTDVSECSNFATWRVSINGVHKSAYSLSYAAGRLTLHRPGMKVVIH